MKGAKTNFEFAEILFRLKKYIREYYTFDRSNADRKYWNELQWSIEVMRIYAKIIYLNEKNKMKIRIKPEHFSKECKNIYIPPGYGSN